LLQAQRAGISVYGHHMPPAPLLAAAVVAACRAVVVAEAGVMMTAVLAAPQVMRSHTWTFWQEHAVRVPVDHDTRSSNATCRRLGGSVAGGRP
jgi:hypothetical protein